MIKFDGVDLEELAPICIEDIDVSPIALNTVARQRPVNFGAQLIRIVGGVRTITISFALLIDDPAEREEYMQALRNWAQIGKELNLELPQYENRYLTAAVTQLPDYSYRKWWENKLKIVFSTFDNPFWTSSEIIEVQCGALFSVGGSAPPLMHIERNGIAPLTDFAYSNGVDVIRFKTIPAGRTIIDLNRQTAAIGNTSIMRYLDPLSGWINPKVGANQMISGDGVIRYRERWL